MWQNETDMQAMHVWYACLGGGGGGGGLILPINCGRRARMSGWWWALFHVRLAQPIRGRTC